MDNLTWLLWKIKVKLLGIELAHKWARNRYCHKGFHRIYHSYLGQGSNGRMKYVHYIRCRHCNYIFFASINDKKRYLKMQDKERLYPGRRVTERQDC